MLVVLAGVAHEVDPHPHLMAVWQPDPDAHPTYGHGPTYGYLDGTDELDPWLADPDAHPLPALILPLYPSLFIKQMVHLGL